MKKKYLIANWKLNHTKEKVIEYFEYLSHHYSPERNKEMVICPAFPFLSLLLEKYPSMVLGSQDVSSYHQGAYTGEVSAEMLSSLGVKYTLVGHSERRIYFHEKDEILKLKIGQCLKYGIQPVFCVGEGLKERKEGRHCTVVQQQLANVLDKDTCHRVMIAYEPVWAIGTGESATPEQIEEMHAMIRQYLFKQYSAREVAILYGGSVSRKNAEQIFSLSQVDGALVGSASLIARDFLALYQVL